MRARPSRAALVRYLLNWRPPLNQQHTANRVSFTQKQDADCPTMCTPTARASAFNAHIENLGLAYTRPAFERSHPAWSVSEHACGAGSSMHVRDVNAFCADCSVLSLSDLPARLDHLPHLARRRGCPLRKALRLLVHLRPRFSSALYRCASRCTNSCARIPTQLVCADG